MTTMDVREGSMYEFTEMWTHMKLLIICLVSSELLEFAKLMKEQ